MELTFGEHWHYAINNWTFNLDTIIMTWIAMFIVLGLCCLLTGIVKLQREPSKAQTFAEICYGFLESIPAATLGKEGRSFTPVVGSLFLFILTANLIGQLPLRLAHLPEAELASPTNDLNLTAALAILATIFYICSGIKKKGLVNYVKHYFQPMWWMFPLNLLEDFTRPLSLSLRLFANILAGEVIIALLLGSFLAAGLPVAMMLFEVFVAFIQAFIFAVLTASYIAGAVSQEH